MCVLLRALWVEFSDFWTKDCLYIIFFFFDCSSHEWICLCSLPSDRSCDEKCWNLNAFSLYPEIYRACWWHSSRLSSVMYELCIKTRVRKFSCKVCESCSEWVSEKPSVHWCLHLRSSFESDKRFSDTIFQSNKKLFWIEVFNGNAWDYYLHSSSLIIIHRMYDTLIPECVFTPRTEYITESIVILSDSRMSSIDDTVNENIFAMLSSQILCCSSARGLRWPCIVHAITW